jgi:predicted 3-demethylubiquinone-9 3-methyltransferase (glyoxalase superfamily)
MHTKISPNLWFDTEALDAAEYYTSVFPDSKVTRVTHYNEAVPDKAGTVLTVEFELAGQSFVGLNGGPEFTFSEAVSFEIHCDDQAETDYYWEKLTDGGSEGPCGWCKDRFGLSWQVVPKEALALFTDEDSGRAARAMKAMFGMKKLDLEALKQAADGVPAA